MTADDSTRPRITSDDDSEIVIRSGGRVAGEAGPEKITIPEELVVLSVRNVVIFPGTVVPLALGREKSRRLIHDILPDQKLLVSVCQKSPETEDPGPEDLYSVGTAGMVLKLLRMEEDSQSIILHGLFRVKIEEWLAREPYLRARIRVLRDTAEKSTETEALVINARNLARRIIELSPNVPEEATVVLNSIEQPGSLADFLASNLQLDIPAKQALLEELEVNNRLRKVSVELQQQLEVLELSQKIQTQVKENIDKTQREYFLQEQLKAIQKELGQMDEKAAEIEEVRQKIKAAGMGQAVEKEVLRELGRLEKIPTVSPEYARTWTGWSNCPGTSPRRTSWT